MTIFTLYPARLIIVGIYAMCWPTTNWPSYFTQFRTRSTFHLICIILCVRAWAHAPLCMFVLWKRKRSPTRPNNNSLWYVFFLMNCWIYLPFKNSAWASSYTQYIHIHYSYNFISSSSFHPITIFLLQQGQDIYMNKNFERNSLFCVNSFHPLVHFAVCVVVESFLLVGVIAGCFFGFGFVVFAVQCVSMDF